MSFFTNDHPAPRPSSGFGNQGQSNFGGQQSSGDNYGGNQGERSDGYSGGQRSGGGGGYGGGQRSGGGGGYSGGGQRSGGNGGFNRQNQKPAETHNYLPVAVVGNNNAPPQVIDALKQLLDRLNQQGFTIRSRGVTTFDEVVEDHPLQYREIHLPWREFESKSRQGVKKMSPFTWHHDRIEAIAARIQPDYANLKNGVKKIVAAQLRAVLGKDGASLALALITYSEDGAQHDSEVNGRSTGDSALGILAANRFYIPVFNLARPDTLQRIAEHFKL